ncbi:MAG: four helix bundle protein [Treponema sp.]|nr:four helix bundle protein [Treponema sp.]
MNIDTETKTKSRQFAVKVVQLCKHITTNKKETTLSEQLLHSGTSIGANLVKADCALSRNEFLGRVSEALQNCAETKYWLELLNDVEFLTEFEFHDTLKDCDELGKLLVGTVKTLRAALTPSPQPK